MDCITRYFIEEYVKSKKTEKIHAKSDFCFVKTFLSNIF